MTPSLVLRFYGMPRSNRPTGVTHFMTRVKERPPVTLTSAANLKFLLDRRKLV